jgi:hypothetical protein
MPAIHGDITTARNQAFGAAANVHPMRFHMELSDRKIGQGASSGKGPLQT